MALIWAAAAVLVLLTFGGGAAQTPENEPAPENDAASSVGGVLEPGGTIKPGTTGSYDAEGYRMEVDEQGVPRFFPKSDYSAEAFAATGACGDGWDHQFTSPGVVGMVDVLALDAAGNIYVGGQFNP